MNENEMELGKFGEYLLLKRLEDEKHARFLVHWLRLFLSAPHDQAVLSLADRIESFLQRLRVDDRYQDWQGVDMCYEQGIHIEIGIAIGIKAS